MLRLQIILLLSGIVLVSLAEDVGKQIKSNSKDKSNKDITPVTHKPGMEASNVVTNHSGAVADVTDKPSNDKVKHEDMKSSATIGLGFYAGVVPFGFSSYPAYPYYRSYYARPYWGYPYYRYRPVPLLLG
ncbi:hypothetical protein GE061_019033 [Apolygus lucorum]|uniref:Uncharacterized protein n=1 Tax=Apolygus lucorum TaxID=248454 RepID=A0A6A4JJZ5_APOLU|nr:hypothetical protein GE061_019033 [Apolygus lucorum]